MFLLSACTAKHGCLKRRQIGAARRIIELSRPYLEGIKFVILNDKIQEEFDALVTEISKKQAIAESETKNSPTCVIGFSLC